MPTVPKLTENRIRQTPVPGVRVSTQLDPEASGYGPSAKKTTKAARDLAVKVENIALAEKQKADKIKVRDASAKMAEFENDFLFNPQTGAINKKGENSFTIPEEFNEAYNEKIEEINSSLANRTQKMAFTGIAQQYHSSIERTINKYISGERLEYDMQVTESVLENESTAAINSYENLERVALAMDRIETTIVDFSKTNGMPEEWEKAKIFDAKNKIHIGVVDNLLTKNTAAAIEYYKSNKEEINQKDLTEYELTKKINAFQKMNVYKLEDALFDKIIEGTATVDDVLSISMPVEEGGIGSKRAKVIVDKIKSQQKSKLKNALALIDGSGISEKEAITYIDLVDKLLSKDTDNFNAKQLLVDALADGVVDSEEGKNINKIKGLLADVNFNNTRGWWINRLKGLKSLFNKENLSNQELMAEIKFMLNKFPEGEEKIDELQQTVDARLRAIQTKKDSRGSEYYEGQRIAGKDRLSYIVHYVNGVPTFIPE